VLKIKDIELVKMFQYVPLFFGKFPVLFQGILTLFFGNFIVL